MINRIFDRLYVGESSFTDEDLARLEIRYVLNLGGVALKHIKQAYVYPIHLSDDGENPDWMFSTALDKLASTLSQGRVLVTCRAGISRSPFIVLLWLQRVGMSREEAYGFLKERHPQTQINPELMEST